MNSRNNMRVVLSRKNVRVIAFQDKDPQLGKDSITQLVDVMDELPLPERDLTSPAVLPIDHLYSIVGRGLGEIIFWTFHLRFFNVSLFPLCRNNG